MAANKDTPGAEERHEPDSAPSSAQEAEERRRRIAEAAYYRAERRGFQTGGDIEDWLEAERQMDASSSEKGEKGEAAASQPGTAGDVSPKVLDRPDFPDLNQAGIEHIEPDGVKQWARRLNVSAPRLREAIQRVGPVVRDVKRYLDENASPAP